MPQKVTIIAPVAILPLKSYTQEATNTEWSDIRVIRTTKRLPVHAGFVQSCRNSTLRTGNCSWGLQGMLLSASYSPRHSRTQELHWQDCRLDSVLLVLFNEFTQFEEQFVWENWLFGLPTLESGQAREVSPLHLQAVLWENLMVLSWTVHLSERWHLLKPNTSQAWYMGEPTAMLRDEETWVFSPVTPSLVSKRISPSSEEFWEISA